MKKVVKASKNSINKVYWAEVRMKVAISTNNTDTDEIEDEVLDAVIDALDGSAIGDYEWIDVSDVSIDLRN